MTGKGTRGRSRHEICVNGLGSIGRGHGGPIFIDAPDGQPHPHPGRTERVTKVRDDQQPVKAHSVADHDRFSILAVDDDDDLRGVIARRFLRRGHDIEQTASPVEALRRAEQKHFDVAILDIALPEMDGVQLLERLRQVDPETQVIMLTAQGTVETAIRAMKLGAYDYLIKPCELAELELQAERAYEKARLARENRTLKAVLRRTEPPGEIIGTTPVIRRVLSLIDKVAPTDSSVLIQGESGTGKELVARALHRGSPRADKPMVVINCAALQESLLENELFGHEKGAFTSAVTAKPGLFELADGGTLFIDEIGEMAPPLQAKLLRALEDRRIRRVGSTREIRTDVRFLAATNKDLAQEVAASRFRDDLYYRLNVITITTPPLRERIEDIPLLVRHFLTLDPRRPAAHRAGGPGAPRAPPLARQRPRAGQRDRAGQDPRRGAEHRGGRSAGRAPPAAPLRAAVPGRPPGVVKRDEPGGPGAPAHPPGDGGGRGEQGPGGPSPGHQPPPAVPPPGKARARRPRDGLSTPLRPEDNRGAHASRSCREWGGIGPSHSREQAEPSSHWEQVPRSGGWGQSPRAGTSAGAETTYTGPSAGRAM